MYHPQNPSFQNIFSLRRRTISSPLPAPETHFMFSWFWRNYAFSSLFRRFWQNFSPRELAKIRSRDPSFKPKKKKKKNSGDPSFENLGCTYLLYPKFFRVLPPGSLPFIEHYLPCKLQQQNNAILHVLFYTCFVRHVWPVGLTLKSRD